MDMGIKGRKAIVCAASKGLGKGCAMALAMEGVDLVINARTKSELDAQTIALRPLMPMSIASLPLNSPESRFAFRRTSVCRHSHAG